MTPSKVTYVLHISALGQLNDDVDALALPVTVLLCRGVLVRLLALLAVVFRVSTGNCGGELDFGTIEYVDDCCVCAIAAPDLHRFVAV